MMDRPLVSVIVPTWRRHALVLDTLRNIREQTYRPIEVLVMSDGPDPDLYRALWSAGQRPADVFTDGGLLKLRVEQCGRHWTSLIPRSFGIGALMLGALLARGEYLMWQADDERATPDHIAHLVDLIERAGVDFVYPQVLMFRPEAPDVQWMIGTDPPEFGQITSILFRATALSKATFRFHMPDDQYPPVHDWDFVSRLMAAGATWTMSDRCTLTHRADHLGGDPADLSTVVDTAAVG